MKQIEEKQKLTKDRNVAFPLPHSMARLARLLRPIPYHAG